MMQMLKLFVQLLLGLLSARNPAKVSVAFAKIELRNFLLRFCRQTPPAASISGQAPVFIISLFDDPALIE